MDGVTRGVGGRVQIAQEVALHPLQLRHQHQLLLRHHHQLQLVVRAQRAIHLATMVITGATSLRPLTITHTHVAVNAPQITHLLHRLLRPAELRAPKLLPLEIVLDRNNCPNHRLRRCSTFTTSSELAWALLLCNGTPHCNVKLRVRRTKSVHLSIPAVTVNLYQLVRIWQLVPA